MSRLLIILIFSLCGINAIGQIYGPLYVETNSSSIEYYVYSPTSLPHPRFTLSGPGSLTYFSTSYSGGQFVYRIRYSAPSSSAYTYLNFYSDYDAQAWYAGTSIYVVSRITSVSLSPGSVPSRCSGTGQSVFTATPNGDISHYTWSISPSSAGSLVKSGGQCTVNWSAGHSGVATLYVTAYDVLGTGASNSVGVSTLAGGAFTAFMDTSPAQICEGESVSFYANASHTSGTTYAWYVDDDNTPRGYGSTYSTSGLAFDAVVRAVVTPSQSLAGQCVTGLTPKTIYSWQANFTIRPRVGVSQVQSATAALCQNTETTTQFTATAIESDSHHWTIQPYNPSAPTATNHAGVISQTGLVTWNPDFFGNANITFTAYGCGGSMDQSSKTIEIKKIPTVFDVVAPAELCRNASGSISLAGLESNVSYQLYKAHPTLTLDHELTRTSANSWNIPIPETTTAPGDYKVVATPSNGCQSVETSTFTIEVTEKAPITISAPEENVVNGTIYACEDLSVTLTASGGSDYEWRANANEFCRLNPDVLPLFPGDVWDFCNPRLDPHRDPNGPNDEITFQVWPWANWEPIYVWGRDAICNEPIASNEIRIIPTPDFHPEDILSDTDLLCKGQAPTTFDIDYSGTLIDYSWNLSAGGSVLVDPYTKSATVTWDPLFDGDAILTFEGIGCGLPKQLKKALTVYKVLEDEENYVRSISALVPVQNPVELFTGLHEVNRFSTSTQFFDGLGRNIQNVAAKATPSLNDLIEVKRYDDFGRESTVFLPYSAAHDFDYRQNALFEQEQFYSNPPSAIAADGDPYSITQFEASPLNRPVKQGAPGTAWQPGSSDPYDLNDHTVKMTYGINGPDEVIWFTYDQASGNVSGDGNGQIRYYPEGELLANKTLDEANNATVEFVDKEGRTLCKKVQYSGDLVNPLYASTYYIYDNLGNLAVVLPPEAVNSAIDQLTQN